MASAAGPVFWCHQCHVETRPQRLGDLLCTFCNSGFVEEMDMAEVEPGISFSSLPLGLSSILRLPSPASVGPSDSLPAVARTDPQVHRPRLVSRQSSNVPSLLDAMMAAMEQFESSGSPGRSSGGSDQGIDQAVQDDSSFLILPPPPMLIVHGGMLNGLGRLEVLIDNRQGLGPEPLPDRVGEYFLGQEFDQLIQLLSENGPNRYGTPPAAKSAVEALPKFKLTEEHMGSEALQCAVCKDEFEVGSEVHQIPCKHMYHPDCILPWLAQHNSCPVCRFELPTDDADYEARKTQGSGSTSMNVDQGGGRQGARQSQEGGGQRERQVEEGDRGSNEGARHFTLWGMPGSSADLRRPSVPFDTVGESIRGPIDSEQEAEERSGNATLPIHWLFRLFSSGSLPRSSSIESDQGNQQRQ